VRQGISVVAGTNIKLLYNRITGTSGNNPGACIDVEVDPQNTLTDVLIEGNYCFNNEKRDSCHKQCQYFAGGG
jgi:hypothetical protein